MTMPQDSVALEWVVGWSWLYVGVGCMFKWVVCLSGLYVGVGCMF